MAAAVESINESFFSELSHDVAPAPAAAPSVSDLVYFTPSSNIMQDMGEEDAKCIYALDVGSSVMKAAETALLDASHVGFEFANNKMKYAICLFVKIVLMELADDRSLEDMFKWNLRNCTQLSIFMEVFEKKR